MCVCVCACVRACVRVGVLRARVFVFAGERLHTSRVLCGGALHNPTSIEWCLAESESL